MPIGFSIWGPPLIEAAAGYGLSKLGGGSKAGPTSPTFRRAEQIGDLSKEYAFDYLLPTAQKEYGKVLPYYEGILKGDRADIMNTLTPEIGTIKDQFGQAQQNISKFTPGGGGQTTQLSELPFRQEAQISNLISTARPQAANALTSIAQQMTGEGLQAGTLGLNAVADQLNALLGKASIDSPLQQQAGAGVYQILQQMLGQMGQGGGGLTETDTPGIWAGASPIDTGVSGEYQGGVLLP
jgi:hypothetical protein